MSRAVVPLHLDQLDVFHRMTIYIFSGYLTPCVVFQDVLCKLKRCCIFVTLYICLLYLYFEMKINEIGLSKVL